MQRQAKKLKFRLTNGKTPVSWQLPIKGMMLKKVVDGVSQGLKRVHYIPGADSIWQDEYKGDEKPKQVFFENGLLEVDPDDKNLLEIIKNHRYLNSHFEAADEDVAAQRELDKMELQEKAIEKVNIANEYELQATAIVLVGPAMVTASTLIAKQKLKALAFNEPEKVLAEMSKGDFNAKFVASLAVLRGVVKINPTQTACMWEDGKIIVHVAAGQNPIEKLGQFLSGNTEESKITLQEIGERVKRSYTKRVEPTGKEQIEEIVSKNEGNNVSLETQGGDSIEEVTETQEAAETTDAQEEPTIEDARELYLKKFGKEVANAKKNDLDWILSKLNE